MIALDPDATFKVYFEKPPEPELGDDGEPIEGPVDEPYKPSGPYALYRHDTARQHATRLEMYDQARDVGASTLEGTIMIARTVAAGMVGWGLKQPLPTVNGVTDSVWKNSADVEAAAEILIDTLTHAELFSMFTRRLEAARLSADEKKRYASRSSDGISSSATVVEVEDAAMSPATTPH